MLDDGEAQSGAPRARGSPARSPDKSAPSAGADAAARCRGRRRSPTPMKRAGRAPRSLRVRHGNLDAAAALAVLDGVLHQVLEHLHQLVAVAAHDGRRIQPLELDAGAVPAASGCRAWMTCDTASLRSTFWAGGRCSRISTRLSESRSSTRRLMRSACSLITLRKRSRASRIVLGGSLQRLDEAAQARPAACAARGWRWPRNRRACGPGDPAPSDRERRSASDGSTPELGSIERCQRCQQPPLHRHTPCSSTSRDWRDGERLVDCRQQLGIARHRGDVPATPAGAEQVLGQAIGMQDVARPVQAPRRAPARHPPSCATGGRWPPSIVPVRSCAWFAGDRRPSVPPIQ